jgi:glycerol-3-phosphate dehydrogenase
LQQVFDLSTASLSSRLQKFNLVKEAIVERGIMIDSASHLTNKVPFVIPCTNFLYSLYYYTGSLMYYLIYGWYSNNKGTNFAMPYFMGRNDLTRLFPYLDPRYSSGVVY